MEPLKKEELIIILQVFLQKRVEDWIRLERYYM